MELTNAEVREILRIIDESRLDELRIETAGFKLHVRRGGTPIEAAAAPSSSSEPAEPVPTVEAAAAPDGEAVTAPMLGVFYRAQSPTEPPFVEVGAQVEPDTVIGLIEVMKLMNSVAAGVSGEVVEILAENGKMVEYGQPLIRVAADR